MASQSYADLRRALDDPRTDPRLVFHHARELSGAFVRNEHLLGLLPPDAPQVMIAGFERAGAAGVGDAYLELAALYVTGGTWQSPLLPQDDDRAIDLYRRAVAGGVDEAPFLLSRAIYRADRAELAHDAWRRAKAFQVTHADRLDALVHAAYLLQAGFGVPENQDAAGDFFAEAAGRGSADGAFELSLRAHQGLGAPQDDQEGLRWTRRAAELGSARASYNLGAAYATGRYGLVRDAEESLRWYLHAAEQDHGLAAFTAGVMLLTGDGGLRPDPQRAARLLGDADYLLGDGVVEMRLGAMGLERPRP
ncbi:sel1 repeat family protein [Tsukamurella sp. M9C]|uniref:tetratricopeptide repeat protein n=1 Tax=Tsukamurella sp. M9C TaxID=2877520 RepID=UPI001CCD84FD|nr:tetratricopeptide repeat protein [Tsukamurella sp. M9C]MCA0156999.1 sel1 repeat family protein [Tsukamurella sp. M9C]